MPDKKLSKTTSGDSTKFKLNSKDISKKGMRPEGMGKEETEEEIVKKRVKE